MKMTKPITIDAGIHTYQRSPYARTAHTAAARTTSWRRTTKAWRHPETRCRSFRRSFGIAAASSTRSA